jgi:hypothetical protein
MDGQKQQTKTTKHTIEFSNNTPGISDPNAQLPRDFRRVLVERTVEELAVSGQALLGDAVALGGLTASRRLGLSYVPDN